MPSPDHHQIRSSGHHQIIIRPSMHKVLKTLTLYVTCFKNFIYGWPDDDLMMAWWYNYGLMMIWWWPDDLMLAWLWFDGDLMMAWWWSDDGLMIIWWPDDDLMAWWSDDDLMIAWWWSDDGLMMIWWPKLVASKVNKILCLSVQINYRLSIL